MKYLCKACRETLPADDSDAGKTLVCSKCGKETSVPAGMFAPGTVIADFEIISHLASGDMGEIYLAENITTREKAAVKILSEDHTYDAKFIVSFIHTGRLAIKKIFPNTVKVLGVGEDDGFFYYAMEFVEGTSLAQVLREEGKLPLERCVKIVKTIASTLADAWKTGRIVHRSIKPDNILIMPDGNVKLADFGLERDFLDLVSRSDEDRLRLVQYAPPELISDFSMSQLDTRSDIYALGAVFYHAVTGQVPYHNFTLSEVVSGDVPLDVVEAKHLNPDLPLRISEILDKMMQRNPKDRYKNFEEFLRNINRVFITDDVAPVKETKDHDSATIKMDAGKRAKVKNLDDEATSSRLDELRMRRESRSQTIILGIISVLLCLGIFSALFVKWIVYEPQRSAREMEINIARMKERQRRQKSLYQPLAPGAVERLCRGVVAHCANEDYMDALRFVNEFSRKYPVKADFKNELMEKIRRAHLFFRQFSNSGKMVAGIPFYSRQYGNCTAISVEDSVITAKTQIGAIVKVQIRTFTHKEYTSYLRGVVNLFGSQAEFRAYLLCTGNFEQALNLVKNNPKELEFYEKVIYGYIRVGLSNASPLEIRQMRMLYGSLDAFQRATHSKN